MNSPHLSGWPRAALILSAVLALAACGGPETASRPPMYQNLAEVSGDLDEAEALKIINAYRANNGVGPVALDDRLTALARVYARDLATKAGASPTIRPDGKLDARLAAAGYSQAEVEESVTAGYYTLAEAFSGWRDSAPHRAAMLMPAATDMGIAAAYLANTKYKVYWVLVMAKPA
ncbi:CAP domain-containing protein [Microbaculum marinum]|uniref:CAP domain-containing protein n=1 Tax=Microbaculum marinum TaxID=1764581 RepID=A0AAW9RKH8_9HYPH